MSVLGFMAITAAAQAQTYHPSFSCPRPNNEDQLASLICDNSDMARVELQLNQVYYALRWQDGRESYQNLKAQAVEYDQRVRNACGIPASGQPGEMPPDAASCYIRQEFQAAQDWSRQLNEPAREEATRDLDMHIALQQQLINAGYAGGGQADGVYGDMMRAAIVKWQTAHNMEPNGFITDVMAAKMTAASNATDTSQDDTDLSPEVASATTAPAAPAPAAPPPEMKQAPAPAPVPAPAPAPAAKKDDDSSSTGTMLVGLLVLLLIATAYLLPSIVALVRGHAYKWVILAINIFGAWTGLGWLAIMVWSVWPAEKSIADPVMGNMTGLGTRNAGDTLGAVKYGMERGYSQEAGITLRKQELTDQQLQQLHRIGELRQNGVLTEAEFEAEKARILKN